MFILFITNKEKTLNSPCLVSEIAAVYHNPIMKMRPKQAQFIALMSEAFLIP